MELTNSTIKFIASLGLKKNREANGCFVAEGTKCVRDTWDHFNCRMIVATRNWYEQFGHSGHLDKIAFASRQQMQRMSQFSTAAEVIAVYDIPHLTISSDEVQNSLNIVLDNVQDPGNLGTIIRLADWFGIKNIFCTPDTVDVYNHKVVQATMGAISHVKVHYCDIGELIAQYPDIPVYGTFLDGDNIYRQQVENRGFVIFGNEGKGISPQLAGLVSRRLLIPAFAASGEAPESLNVGVAAAITISEFRRRTVQ